MADKKAQTVATYDAAASRMIEKFEDTGTRVDDVVKGFALAGVAKPNVLEIGCGYGREAKEILKRPCRYLGIDISASMIALARERVPEGRFKVTDIEEYDFPEKLDLIFAFASLLHSEKERVLDVLRKAHEALNPGGVFYISLKNGTYREETKTDEFGARTQYWYTPDDIKELAGSGYATALEETMTLRGQEWFVIALKKI